MFSEFVCSSTENNYKVKLNRYRTTNDKMRAFYCHPNGEVTNGAGHMK